jgi:hypothetical protein
MSEVWLWQAYFNTEYSRHEKIDWYLAQIAMAIEKSVATKKRTWKVSDYLLKFKSNRRTTEVGAEEAKRRALAWLTGMAGMKPKGRGKKK